MANGALHDFLWRFRGSVGVVPKEDMCGQYHGVTPTMDSVFFFTLCIPSSDIHSISVFPSELIPMELMCIHIVIVLCIVYM